MNNAIILDKTIQNEQYLMNLEALWINKLIPKLINNNLINNYIIIDVPFQRYRFIVLLLFFFVDFSAFILF